jgi:hypothetical protein
MKNLWCLEKAFTVKAMEVRVLNLDPEFILNSTEITGIRFLIKEIMMPRKKTTTKKKSTVNKAGNYTKPTMRKRLFEKIKSGSKGGNPGQWSARKAQLLAKEYKAKGGGYK